jgi:hypothetical protein
VTRSDRMAVPPLRLSARGAVVAPAERIAELAEQFRAQQVIKLPGFIAPPLLAWIHREMETAEWFERTHTGLTSTEQSMRDNTCLGLLHFLVNDPATLGLVETISGQQPLTAFVGRVYRRYPGVHEDQWHDDCHPHRRVGLSVNLSRGVYDGGVFELRLAESEQFLGSMTNVGFGDAILFAIGEHLQHRVSPLEGTVAKTAFAGWFGGQRDYNAILRRDPTLEQS